MDLDFAYVFPFSNEARDYIRQAGINKIEKEYLDEAFLKIKELAKNNKIEFMKTILDNIKVSYIITFAYTKMLLFAFKYNYLINAFAEEEARRSIAGLNTLENNIKLDYIKRIASELNLVFKMNNDMFVLSVFDILKIKNKSENLTEMHLFKGEVYMNINEFLNLIRDKIRENILNSFSKLEEPPKEVISFANEKKEEINKIIFKESNTNKTNTNLNWIEALLKKPIDDGRHRVVNLILAPYLVNVKGLPIEEAVRIISNYIEECKKVNPNTKINETYIRYQCEYAKKRGLKPLSKEKAKTIFGDLIDT